MIFACETFEISLLYFLYYVKNTGGSLMRLLDVKGTFYKTIIIILL